jgi:hypothetical protein
MIKIESKIFKNTQLMKISLLILGIIIICICGVNNATAANVNNTTIYVNNHTGNNTWNGLSSTYNNTTDNDSKSTIINVTGTTENQSKAIYNNGRTVNAKFNWWGYNNITNIAMLMHNGHAYITTTKGTIRHTHFITRLAESTLTYLTTDEIGYSSSTMDHQTVTTKINVTNLNLTDLITAEDYVKNYYGTTGVLKSNLTINNLTFNLPNFLQLLVKRTLNIKTGDLNSINVANVNPAPNPHGSYISGKKLKSKYLSIASDIQNFINNHKRALNHAKTSLGSISFSKLVYTFSKL